MSPGRAAGALALAALAGGCGELVRPDEFVPAEPEQLLVHAVLRAASDSAAVMVSRVGTGQGGVPVPGARVRLAGSAGETVLAQVPGGAEPCAAPFRGTSFIARGTCYAAAIPGGIRAGAEYRLEVEVPNGERARGRTVVPLPPVPQSPAEGMRLPSRAVTGWLVGMAPVELKWATPREVEVEVWVTRAWSPASGNLRCYANTRRPDQSIREDLVEQDLVADSARRVLQAGGCEETRNAPPVRELDSLEVAVGMTAYDDSYLRYIREWKNGVPARAARGGLEGAYGIFGGAATATRHVRMIPQ